MPLTHSLVARNWNWAICGAPSPRRGWRTASARRRRCAGAAEPLQSWRDSVRLVDLTAPTLGTPPSPGLPRTFPRPSPRLPARRAMPHARGARSRLVVLPAVVEDPAVGRLRGLLEDKLLPRARPDDRGRSRRAARWPRVVRTGHPRFLHARPRCRAGPRDRARRGRAHRRRADRVRPPGAGQRRPGRHTGPAARPRRSLERMRRRVSRGCGFVTPWRYVEQRFERQRSTQA